MFQEYRARCLSEGVFTVDAIGTIPQWFENRKLKHEEKFDNRRIWSNTYEMRRFACMEEAIAGGKKRGASRFGPVNRQSRRNVCVDCRSSTCERVELRAALCRRAQEMSP
ncbi:uncharacterized protein LOC143349798 [Colletes latitarsis]|uniref:uncharacterized protein LOC143349798 n=1 Tax=Colletes latitarsis TaxID=2605962 RepID=UPI004035C9A9